MHPCAGFTALARWPSKARAATPLAQVVLGALALTEAHQVEAPARAKRSIAARNSRVTGTTAAEEGTGIPQKKQAAPPGGCTRAGTG